MSISLPLFFEPYKITDRFGKKHYIVDGGMLSNYPVFLLDNGKTPPKRPVFGFRFLENTKNPHEKEHDNQCEECDLHNLIEYIKAIMGTLIDSIDTQYMRFARGDEQRTIKISTTIEDENQKKTTIKTTDFDITKEQSLALYQNGIKAGEQFFSQWNFSRWKEKYRSSGSAR
jgi:NTE family protein